MKVLREVTSQPEGRARPEGEWETTRGHSSLWILGGSSPDVQRLVKVSSCLMGDVSAVVWSVHSGPSLHVFCIYNVLIQLSIPKHKQ